MPWDGLVQWVNLRPALKQVLLVLYYVLLMIILLLMYGRGDFTTPAFEYGVF